MKKFLFLAVLFIACKKDSDKENAAHTTAVKVLDSVTHTPVVGADVILFRCDYDCVFGITSFFSGKTDNNGMVSVPTLAYQTASVTLNVIKSDYLPFNTLTVRGSTLNLMPKGWLRMHIVKTNNYPPGSQLTLYNQFDPWGVNANTAADSTFVVTGGGGVINHVSFQVLSPQNQLLGGGNGEIPVPRFDTVSVTINY